MLIGRDSERARLHTAITEAVTGRSRAVVIVGEPGVGKTALLDDAAATATHHRVVRATGYEAETDLAFAGLASILAGFHDLIAELPPPQQAALSGALGTGPPLPPGDRFTAYVAALNLLAMAAEAEPLVIAVDDAHWLDPASLDALAFVARRIAAEGIVMLLAARYEPPAMTERAEGIEVLTVTGLDAEAAARLVRSRAPTAVPDAVAARLLELSAGNPLALIEAATELSPNQLIGREPLPDVLPVGESLARAFMARAERLPPDARRALLIAAAGAGEPSLVSETLGQLGLRDELRAAEDAELVELGADGPTFRHPLIRTGAYRAATPAERRDAHAALSRVAAARSTAGLHAAAHHRAAAAEGPDEDAAAALETAGRHAASRLGYAEAANLLARAATLSTSPQTRAPRLLESGTLAVMAGQPDAARRNLDQALVEALDPHVRAAAGGARAYVEMWTGDVIQARTMLLDLARHLEHAAPAVAAKTYVDAAIASSMGADPNAIPLTMSRALQAAEGTEAQTITRHMHAAAAFMVADPEALARLAAIDDPLDALSGDPLDYGRVGFVVTAYVWGGMFDRARELTDRLQRMAHALSAPSMLPVPLAAITALEDIAGNWGAGIAAGLAGVQIAGESGQPGVAAWAHSQLARIHARRGDEAATTRHGEAAMAGAQRTSAQSIPLFVDAALGQVRLALGDQEEAARRLMRTFDGRSAADMRSHVVLPYLPDLAEAAMRSDRRDIAEQAFARLVGCDPCGVAQTRAAVARCRGLMEDDPAAAAGHLREAVALEDAAGLAYEAARSRLLLGERLLRTRRRNDALEPLERAFAAFDRMGSAAWADRTADALGTLRARPSRTTVPIADLTAQELQVATAAAQGLTNKQIAAQLFLSVKTVEFHLRNAYGKLGVRSRTQLSLRLRPNVDGTAAPDDG